MRRHHAYVARCGCSTLSHVLVVDGFDELIDEMSDEHNSEACFSGRGAGSLSGESLNESIVYERRRARSAGSGSPAALLRPLSRAGCLSPEHRSGDMEKSDGLRKGKAHGVGSDENSPLLGNMGHAAGTAGGKLRAITVPRLVLGDARTD